jgi:hypothetical protein
MPSGDAQRTWFPEMIVRLRSGWHEEMSIPALIGLRDELDETLHRIRDGRNIQRPIITCRRCGRTGHAAEPRVSVRALILALARFEIASKDQARVLEKEGQHTASNTGWTSKEQPWYGSRKAARIEDHGQGFPPRTWGSEFCEAMRRRTNTNDATRLRSRFAVG